MNTSKLSLGLGSIGFLGLIVAVALPGPRANQLSHFTEKEEPGFDQPIAAALFRQGKRLSDDGTIPEKALSNSLRARNELVSPLDGAGIYPAAWTWHGPANVGGRVRDILIHPTQPNIMYTGGLSGGMWKSTDSGATWTALDDFMAVLPVGCMAMDMLNPSRLWVGTGEGFFETEEGSSNTAAVRGAGIFVSNDAGSTWNQLPSTDNADFELVNRLAFHPSNSAIAFASTSTGMFRTTDSGVTWTKVANGWMYDIRINPSNPNLMIAGTHDLGVMYSTNAGITWLAATGDGDPHRSEVRYAPSNPSIVYSAASDANQIKIYRSTDGGQTFTLKTTGSGISTYDAYNNVLWVNPSNSDSLILGGVFLYRSSNQGTSFTQGFNNVHADMHAIVSHPQYNGTTNRIVYFGTDGGIYRANDHTSNTVSALNTGLGITQFYGAVMNPANNLIYGGTQDNGTKRVTAPSVNWLNSFGGDGGYCEYDPSDPNYVYGEIYYAQIFRSTNGGVNSSYIYSGIADAGSAVNCNFIPYFMLDPNNPNTMLVGARSLWRSTNVKAGTPTWTAIKGTIQPPGRPEPSKEKEAHMRGNPEWNISTLTVAKADSNIIWVGYNNGQVWKTSNGLAATPSWTRIDGAGSATPARWVSQIVIDPINSNRVWVAYMGYEPNNLWRTDNAGSSWTETSGNLPGTPISGFAVNPNNSDWLYAGTDIGLFTSSDGGLSWSTSNQGPATVPIEELRWVTPTKLLCVTHGRGVYSADIVGTEEPLSPDSISSAAGTGSGRLSDVYFSENRSYQNIADVINDMEFPSWVQFDVTSPHATLSSLKVMRETSCTDRSTLEKLWLFNWTTNQFEQVDASVPTLTDTVRETTVTGTLSRFVRAGDKLIRGRLTWAPNLADRYRAWTSKIDQLLIKVVE